VDQNGDLDREVRGQQARRRRRFPELVEDRDGAIEERFVVCRKLLLDRMILAFGWDESDLSGG
jgi:hypothetical protein